MGEDNKKKKLLSNSEIRIEEDSHQDFKATIRIVDEILKAQGFEIAYDTRKVIAEPGQMGGKTIYRARDGRAIVVNRIPLCDACNNSEMEKYYICHNCGRKTCIKCYVRFQGVHLCKLCFMIQEPLDKREFKVLLAIASEVTSVGKIARAARIRKEETKLAMQRLCGNDYVMLDNRILRKKYVLTDKGEEVLEAYLKIYGACFDILAFCNRLRE